MREKCKEGYVQLVIYTYIHVLYGRYRSRIWNMNNDRKVDDDDEKS